MRVNILLFLNGRKFIDKMTFTDKYSRKIDHLVSVSKSQKINMKYFSQIFENAVVTLAFVYSLG